MENIFTLDGYRISRQYTFEGIPSSQTLIYTLNPHSFVVAEKDREFREALENCDVLIPDGIGIIMFSRMLWKQKFGKFSGDDLHRSMLLSLNQVSARCFYLGANDYVLSTIEERLQKDNPNIKFGSFSPPYKKEFTDADNETMIAAINSFNPDVLFVGMTAPKQEKWLHKHKSRLNAKVMCAIGGAFNFYAGTIPRAPKWMIDCGIEWLFRLMREPKRMWKRNFISTPVFVGKMIRLKFNSNNTKYKQNVKGNYSWQTVMKETEDLYTKDA